MRTSTPLDEILWAQYRAQPSRPIPANLHAPQNYRELAERIDLEPEEVDVLDSKGASAWSSFLHAFFYYKTASFFEERPPGTLSVHEQALWAGVAEGLCNKLDLPVPEWVNQSRYFLVEPWDSNLLYSTLNSSIAQRLSESDPEFSRRNIVARIRDFLVA